MKPESNGPISIGDLLRLKRAERPPAEFWTTFDQELRAKQLAALVGKRPWWQNLPKAFAQVSRYRLPIGASAVAAIAFFSLRDNEVTPRAQYASMAGDPVAIETATEVSPPPHPVAYSDGASETPAASVALAQESAAPVVAVAQSHFATEVPQMVSLENTVSIENGADVESSPGRRMTVSLASVQLSETVRSRSLLDVANGFEAQATPVRAAIEPLQQMTLPSDTRRSRLLTAMVSTASLESSNRTTARAASRIDEERLYDQIHRFGARGDRVQVKF
jgi:hypothetical protein